MKQILQNLKNGQTNLADVPCPSVRPGQLLIRTRASLISSGTERMLVEFGKANLIEKARQQPDKVRMVLDKIRTDGLLATLNAVSSKLDQPLPLGYCNVGRVVAVGKGVTGYAVGDRVASNGKHAEVVSVPANLCVHVPDDVTDDAAAFTVIGSIALQGIRLAQPALGEVVVVTGLGLIGLIAVQLLRAQGCRVIGIDFDADKLALARSYGAEVVDLGKGEDPVAAATAYSRGRGVDAVLITASTSSNEPMHQAAQMCRKRGRIVLVGVTGLELSRADFYEKELSFQVSCSYGPGRYDPKYEEEGHDYPVGFVRWTEQRNFEAMLDMLASRRIEADSLISHRFGIRDAQQAYDLISGEAPSLGVLLQYEASQEEEARIRRQTISLPVAKPAAGKAVVGFIGSGNYATQVLIPAFAKTGARLKSVACSSGVSGYHAGRKFGFEQVTTDTRSVLADPEITAVVIATRHDSHAALICEALRAGKHVFVEKPLALTAGELDDIRAAYEEANRVSPRVLTVGFNRRFAPHVLKAKQLLESVQGPKSFVMMVNAGLIPTGHWTQDREIGGGRIIGEGCHFVDLLRYLAGAPITSIQAKSIGGAHEVTEDKSSFTLGFADGSIGTIHYFANGHKSFPKERLEIFCAGQILQLDNFRKLSGFGWRGFGKMSSWRQDKGQENCAARFVEVLEKGGDVPIPFDELIEVSRVTIQIAEALRA